MADKRISELPITNTVVGTDYIIINNQNITKSTKVDNLSSVYPNRTEIINLSSIYLKNSITATGSTSSRNINDRFADIINVKDFGAVGDGVTDDTAAITAAIAEGSSSKTVLIPNGVYKITSNITANCPVIFNGVMSISSPTVVFRLNSQPIVIDDYRKIYMGEEWNNQNAPGGLALKRAIEQLFSQNRYHTLHGLGRQMRLEFQIDFYPINPSYAQYKYISDLYIVLQNDGTFGTRDSTTGVITPKIDAYTFYVDSPEPSSVFGIIFDKIRISCRNSGNGIFFNCYSNKDTIIHDCNITNPYNMGIKSLEPIKIEMCRIAGGESALDDDDRIATGIEIGKGDSEITNTTVQYFKTCVLVKEPTLLINNCHFFNKSSHGRAPILHITAELSDLRATGCYWDNGPIWIENTAGGYNTAGRCSFQNCIFTYTGSSRGNRSNYVLIPNGNNAVFRGINISNCQFRDYRIFGRELTYIGNGTTKTYVCPLTDTSASYVNTGCTITNGSKTVKANGYKLVPGLKVTGTGIPSNTVIESITDDFTIQISKNATSSSFNATLTFSETLEVTVDGIKVFNWTLSEIVSEYQEITFDTAPANNADIILYSKYFAVVPFDVNTSNGTIDPDNCWDMYIKDNSFYNYSTNDSTDFEPVLRQSSTPILRITTNSSDVEYDVNWEFKTPFKLNLYDIESIGWRWSAITATSLAPPTISYHRISSTRGKIRLSSAQVGVVLLKGYVSNRGDDINIVN